MTWVFYFLCVQVAVNLASNADELLFIQAVWRHGDRLPISTYPKDQLNETGWINLGFQGFGQLTAKGMAQHNIMGQRLRARYVKPNSNPDATQILSPSYNSKEIYIRSTDVNRTIQSAMSNLLGMLDPGKPGVDFPDVTASWQKTTNYTVKWPGNFVPIAVHTVDDDTDHLGNPDADCPRQTQLWKMVTETEEYKNLSQKYSTFLSNISSITGMTVNLDNLWIIQDVIFIKKDNHLTNATYLDLWLNTSFLEITNLNNIVEDWNNGLDLAPNKNPPVDFKVEIPRIRGGALLWDIIFHMQLMINCTINNTDNNACKWLSQLKYYVYSAHDTTLAALATTLGFKRTNYDEDGYPLYSTTVTFELWKNSTDNSFYVQVLYWPLNNSTDTVTDQISGCTANCSFEAFYNRSLPFRPGHNGDPVAWCNYVNDLTSGKSNSSSKNEGMRSSTLILTILIALTCMDWLFILN